MQNYYNETKIFLQASNIESNCNAIMFVNTGTTIAQVNGIYLQPNQSISFNGNACEMDVTKYYCSFSGVGTDQLTVIRKLFA